MARTVFFSDSSSLDGEPIGWCALQTGFGKETFLEGQFLEHRLAGISDESRYLVRYRQVPPQFAIERQNPGLGVVGNKCCIPIGHINRFTKLLSYRTTVSFDYQYKFAEGLDSTDN